MNKLIVIASIILLSACDNRSPKEAATDLLQPLSLCINGLAFATIHNSNGNAITQIFEPAKSPINPAQPKTCKDQERVE